jgi:hypothetical protein
MYGYVQQEEETLTLPAGMSVQVQVVATPKGEAPLEVRQSWIQCIFTAHLLKDALTEGVLNYHQETWPLAFEVTFGEAMAALDRLERTDARRWWEQWALTEGRRPLIFDGECCRIGE